MCRLCSHTMQRSTLLPEVVKNPRQLSKSCVARLAKKLFSCL